MLAVLVQHVDDVGSAKDSYYQKEGRYEGRKDTENNRDFIVELEDVCSVALAPGVVRQLCDLHNVVECPEAIGNIVKCI